MNLKVLEYFLHTCLLLYRKDMQVHLSYILKKKCPENVLEILSENKIPNNNATWNELGRILERKERGGY